MSASHLLLIPLDKDMYGLVNPIFPNGIRILNKIQADIVRYKIISHDTNKLKELIDSQHLSTSDIEFFLNKTVNNTLLCTQRDNVNITLRQLDIWLHVTNNCNLNCHYCFVNKSVHTKDVLSVETSDLLIEKIKAVILEYQTEYISFRFSGGEPLLNFNVIE